MPTTTSPLAALAAAIGGIPADLECGPGILVGDGFIYGGINNKLRLQRPGHAVVDLGSWRDDVDSLAEQYWAVTR